MLLLRKFILYVDFVYQLQVFLEDCDVSFVFRKLLGGVDNLRLMATSLENIYRIEERSDTFMSDYSEDTGPAL